MVGVRVSPCLQPEGLVRPFASVIKVRLSLFYVCGGAGGVCVCVCGGGGGGGFFFFFLFPFL